MVQNRKLIYKAIPEAFPEEGKHLVIEGTDLDLNASLPADSVLTKSLYISFDPYQRGRMRDPKIKSYAPAYNVGEPVTNRAISQVLKSNNADYSPGDILIGQDASPFEEYSIQTPALLKRTRKLDNPHNLDLSVFLGPLGMPGLTAYSSFYEIGTPKKGETIFISAASGAVGQIVGQLAKHEGLKVIGSVGSDDKLDYIIKELGFDGGFNYKKEKPREALARLAPQGIDIYFENVGGEQLEASLNAMNNHGRVIACGMISQYNLPREKLYPISNLVVIVAKRIRFQGFIVGDEGYGPKYYPQFVKDLSKWIHEGSFKFKIDETVGMENAAQGFIGMLQGKNFGKAVLKVGELEKGKL